MLKIEPIAAFNDNYIWLLHDATEVWVVDPGDASVVFETLDRMGQPLTGILVTHHHFDHVGGIKDLVSRYRPRVIGPHNPDIEHIDQRVGAQDHVHLFGLDFAVLTIPGHTLDHIAYYAPDAQPQPLLFCGDTLFAGGCGRIFEGTPEMMFASLQQLASLPRNTSIYCAHEYTLANLAFAAAVEPNEHAIVARIARDQGMRQRNVPTVPSVLEDELHTNPFLRCDSAGVISAAQQRAGKPLASSEAVFTEIRAWKNAF
jgi:hydroxyacylglutathione hydrolase